MRHLSPLCLAAVLCLSCYQPEFPAGQFKCATDVDCPAGLVCGDSKLCVKDGGGGGAEQDSSMGSPDMAAPADMSMVVRPDLTMVDPPDMTLPACKGSGQQVATDVWACKGTFDRGKAADLCQAAYRVCRVDMDAALLSKVTRCDGGFFGVSFDASIRWMEMDRPVRCPPENNTARAVIGCGSGEGSVSFKNECGTLNGLPAFRQTIICGNPADRWECSNGLGDARHLADTGGVLCCKR